VIAVMLAAQEWGAKKDKVLNYMNSGDMTGDCSQVVGYRLRLSTGQGPDEPGAVIGMVEKC